METAKRADCACGCRCTRECDEESQRICQKTGGYLRNTIFTKEVYRLEQPKSLERCWIFEGRRKNPLGSLGRRLQSDPLGSKPPVTSIVSEVVVAGTVVD